MANLRLMVKTTYIDELNRSEIRQQLRTQRAALSVKQRLYAAINLAKQSRHSLRLIQAKRVLSYAPFAGEISPEKLLNKLHPKQVMLPKISNYRLRKMDFLNASKLEKSNKFGILEPQAIGSPTPANQLDVILMPLVAFDRCGNRLGMGQGYYDRALQALSHQQSTRPFLVGLAYHFQEIKSCQATAWDVPLDAILTDQEFIIIK